MLGYLFVDVQLVIVGESIFLGKEVLKGYGCIVGGWLGEEY